ncbi:hypothetical protein EV182_003096, partial [Spiromyces aspiralis]
MINIEVMNLPTSPTEDVTSARGSVVVYRPKTMFGSGAMRYISMTNIDHQFLSNAQATIVIRKPAAMQIASAVILNQPTSHSSAGSASPPLYVRDALRRYSRRHEPYNLHKLATHAKPGRTG